MLNYSILTADTNQAKSLSIVDNKLVKSSLANPTRGYFTAHACNTLHEFADHINKLTVKQSLIIGSVVRPDKTVLAVGEKIALTTKAKSRDNAVSRSLDYLKNLNHAGFMLFDIDSRPESFADLQLFIPELQSVGAVVKPSSSSLIFDKNGAELVGDKGRHIFVPVMDMSDIERAAKAIWARQWLAGYGHYLISNGIHPMLLERGIYDQTVLGHSERLAFEAKPILNDGLTQKYNHCVVIDGGFLDTRLIADLTTEELEQVEALKHAAKKLVRPEYDAVITRKKAEYIATGKTQKDWEGLKNHVLPFDFEVTTTKGVFKVDDLNQSHDGVTLRDPFEPDYDGGSLTKAKFFWNDGNPKIYSQAHGGINYKIGKREFKQAIQLPEQHGIYELSERCDWSYFTDVIRDQKGSITKILPTKQNLKALLAVYGIHAIYDEPAKQQQILIPNDNALNHDMHNEQCYQQLIDLCALNGIDTSIVDRLPMVITDNTINPIKDWIFSERWDGRSRLKQLCHGLVTKPENRQLSNRIIKTWLIQCVAALDKAKKGLELNPYAKPKFELILILQGDQGLTKTTWITNLLPQKLNGEMFSNRYIKDGSNLQLDNKDSIKQNISCWINELGELDATFRKTDIAQLKAFCSNQKDIIRLPYGKTECYFTRSTSFCATVNDDNFLNDTTGSRRFGTVKVEEILEHTTNMQQLWAEIWELYSAGEQWWLDKETEQAMQARNNANHQTINPVEDAILTVFAWDVDSELWDNKMTATEIYQACFDKKPNQRDLNMIKPIINKLGVKVGATKGKTTYSMPNTRAAQ
jgi:putative DNA primase/helicase